MLYERLAYLFCFCVPTSTGIGGGSQIKTFENKKHQKHELVLRALLSRAILTLPLIDSHRDTQMGRSNNGSLTDRTRWPSATQEPVELTCQCNGLHVLYMSPILSCHHHHHTAASFQNKQHNQILASTAQCIGVVLSQ